MKLSDVRLIIREELLRTVPEFMTQQVATDCVERVRNLILKHIDISADSHQHRHEMIGDLDETLKDLEKEISFSIEETITRFLSSEQTK